MTPSIAITGPDLLGAFCWERGRPLPPGAARMLAHRAGRTDASAYEAMGVALASGATRAGAADDANTVADRYDTSGPECVRLLRRGGALAVFDPDRHRLLVACDHMSLENVYYARIDGVFVFGTRVDEVLRHDGIARAVDMSALDQMLTFPGMAGGRTMFEGVSQLPAGHYATVDRMGVTLRRYWSMDFPPPRDDEDDEATAVRELVDALSRSVAETAGEAASIGVCLSGGLDSSFLAALVARSNPRAERHAFSVRLPGANDEEMRLQEMVARHTGFALHPVTLDPGELGGHVRAAVRHAGSPLKASYASAAALLGPAARSRGLDRLATGEGADELFAGHVGHRFARARTPGAQVDDVAGMLERQMRERLWGDPDCYYEKEYHQARETNAALYAPRVRERFREFDCLAEPLVDRSMLRGRDPIAQRSVLDLAFRTPEHLAGDRVARAAGVRTDYPYLDRGVMELAARIPARWKLKGMTDKYILRRAARGVLPAEVVERSKDDLQGPATHFAAAVSAPWTADLLARERLQADGYFDPDTVQRLVCRCLAGGASVHEQELLAVVLTFGVFLDVFGVAGER